MKKIILSSSILILIGFNSIAQRKVLVEQFTNSGCPPCAGNTPVVASYVNANLNQVLMLAYHTAFPYNDSMYFENQFQSNQRVAFYGVSGVPTSRVDGNFFSGNLVSTLSTTIPNAGAVAPRYSISFSTSTLNSNQVNVSVLLESTDASNTGEPLKAMIVVAERNVLKSSYVCCAGANSETEYPWVVRKMLPDENGTALVNTTLGGTDIVNVNLAATNIKDFNELRIVAFVQNTSTKAIYQTEISTPLNITGVNELEKNPDALFVLFPTVAKNNINVQLNKAGGKSKISILNLLGSEIYSLNTNFELVQLQTSDFSSGIYFVKVENETGTQMKKVILQKE